MTLWFFVGTAAELIKLEPLIRGASQRGWDWRVVSTGQSGLSFWTQYDDFLLPRNCSRQVLLNGEDLSGSVAALKWFFGAMFSSPKSLLAGQGRGRQVAVVHGDTLSTLIGAVWARRLKWPVAHVEAGLRSQKLFRPFPEEICRRLVSRLVTLHFAPDALAAENLRAARVSGRIIESHGNTLWDALAAIEYSDRPENSRRPVCVANIHRFENLNSQVRWSSIVGTLLEAASRYKVVMVLHSQTAAKLQAQPRDREKLLAAGVELRSRMKFREFIGLVRQSLFLITDGGSNQEETFYLGKPCLLMRDTTERREGIGSTALLSHFDSQKIRQFLEDPTTLAREPVHLEVSPSQVILSALSEMGA